MDTLKKIVDGIGELITDTVMTEQEGSRRCLNSEDLNNLTEWMDLIDDVRKGNHVNSENANCAIFDVMPRFSDDEDEDEFGDQEPDYYTCMCCGNVQEKGMSCNKCAGPTTESFY